MRHALRQKSKPSWGKSVLFAAGAELQLTFEHIDEALCRRGSKCASICKFRRHLRKARTQLRCDMDHELHVCCAGQRCANKGVWRLQKVIRLQTASC